MTNPPSDFDTLVATMAAWVLLGAVGWTLLIALAALLEAATAGRVRVTAWVGCPSSLRRVLLAALGVTLAAAPVPALASPTGLPSPARPTGAAPQAGERVVVRPGDSLWRLAADRLPTSAGSGQVAHVVARVHRRNREVIGPDPDLIHPGQHLVLPRHLPHPSSRHLEEKP